MKEIKISDNLTYIIITLIFVAGLVIITLFANCGGGKTILETTHKKNINGWFESDST